MLAHGGSPGAVATNPAGTAGAVISTAVEDEQQCVSVVTEALADLD